MQTGRSSVFHGNKLRPLRSLFLATFFSLRKRFISRCRGACGGQDSQLEGRRMMAVVEPPAELTCRWRMFLQPVMAEGPLLLGQDIGCRCGWR